MYFIDYSASLSHHGVKGMKWGVRNEPESLGNRQARRIARYDKKLGRINAQQNKLNTKIKRSDSNAVIRRTLNDSRRGKAMGLGLKAARIQAKKDYTLNKTKSNKRKLRDARVKESAFSLSQHAIPGVSNRAYGQYSRNRKSGKSAYKSLAIAGGTAIAVTAATAPAISAAKKYGMKYGRRALNIASQRLQNRK